MATRLRPQLHPETERYLGFATWTADPAVKALFSAIKALIPVGEALSELSANRPSIDRRCGDEVGRLTIKRCDTGRFGTPDAITVSGTGAVGTIWDELDALRGRWIVAHLTAEGLHSDMGDFQKWFDRKTELEDAAVSVDAAWVAFQRGGLS